MASVDSRTRTGRDGKSYTVYRVIWRDPARKQRSRTFKRKVDADRFARSVEVDIDRGQYIDPAAGRITFAKYLEQYRATRTHRASTVAASASRLDRHVVPTFGDRTLASIRRSDVQAWASDLAGRLAPATVETIYKELAGVFREAVHDGVLAASPCRRIALPTIPHGQVVPLRPEHVHQLVTAAPTRYRALLVLCAGTGLRQGEALGLTVDRVDFLRRTLTVDRQMSTPARGLPTFGPPKTPASVRTLPLPRIVGDELAAHLARHGEGPDRLIFTAMAGGPMRRSYAGSIMAKTVAAVRKAEQAARAEAVAAGRTSTTAPLPDEVTMHDLRHFYASLLIAQGQSVKVVQQRLGHRSAVETLDTYGHLWPDSEEDTITAVDAALAPLQVAT